MKPKRNLFAALGRLVWKTAALLGSQYARRKLDQSHQGAIAHRLLGPG